MNNPLISIIIPIYNAEKYLRQCLDSVIAQTPLSTGEGSGERLNWECLLVDDGSKDSSGTICDEYASKDSRFKVFHKENGGVSSARNKGIEKAKGEWIYFCDADDTLSSDALSTFVNLMTSEVDFLMGGYKTLDEDGNIKRLCPKEITKTIGKDDAFREMYQPADFGYQGYLWCKLMKASIIRDYNMHFDENISFNEDRLFIVEYISHISNQVAYTTHCVYNYVDRASGATGSLKVSYNKKYATDFDAYVKMKEIVCACTDDVELKKLAIGGIITSYVVNHRFMVQFHDYDSSIHHHMVKEMKRTGSYFYYLKRVIRDLLLLIYPKFVVKYQK